MNRDKASGAAIVVGAVAMIVTMALHPSGGSLERIARIAPVAIAVHSLAIASLPVSLLGFLGLTSRLAAARILAPSAFVVYAFGAVAGMCAATINGLATPAFVVRFADADPATLETVRMVVAYNMALNAGFDYILMASIAVASMLWSAAILTTRVLPRWIGIVGAAAGLAALVLVLGGFIGLDVHDFGMFIFGYAGWAILIGVLLWRSARVEEP